MFIKYADIENKVLIDHSARLGEWSEGISLANKIYLDTKNNIDYVPNNVLQMASETLSSGRGNNFSKNILLYSLLKISGFDCELRYKYIVDNTKVIACRNNVIIPWFYVHMNLSGQNLEMDCSLDKAYQKSAGVILDGNDMEYSIEKYMVNNKRAFAQVSMDIEENQETVLEVLARHGRAQVYSRSRGIGHV